MKEITIHELEQRNKPKPEYIVTYTNIHNKTFRYKKYFMHAHEAISFIKQHEKNNTFRVYEENDD